MANYHSIPVDFGALLKKKLLPQVTIKASVREYIYLLLLTQQNEWRYDSGFQCLLWEKDFEQTDNLNIWLDQVRDDIRLSVVRYESRLNIQEVDVQRDELRELNNENKVSRIRNRLNIRVKGTVIQTGDHFDEIFLMFFGPITVI